MQGTFQDRASLACFLGLLFLALGLLLWMAGPFLLAVFAGQLLALVSEPMYRWLLKRRLHAALAALAVTLAVLVLLIIPFFVVGLLAARQGAATARQVQSHELLTPQGLERALWPLERLLPDPSALTRHFSQALRAGAAFVAEATVRLVKALPWILIDASLAIVSCFFLLLTGDRLIDGAAALLPLDGEVRASVVDAFKATATLTLWASLATATAHALLVGLSFLALGVPAALFAGASTFVLAWIPIVGSTPVWIAGGVYLAVSGAFARLAGMLALALTGFAVDHLMRPLILRGRAKIPALAGLVAILGGLRVFGLFGLFLGPVLAAELLTLLDLWPMVARRYGLDVGEDRAPPL